MSVTAIILAAGSGSRMKLNITKQKIQLRGESVLHRAVMAFDGCADIDSIIVVVREDEINFAKDELQGISKVEQIVSGGSTRVESARIGFSYVRRSEELVAIHDAARCFITEDMISAVIRDAKMYGAATASSPVTDTIKTVGKDGKISSTVARASLRAVQTPQVFRTDIYERALAYADLCDPSITDDNMLVERIGVYPYLTDTGKQNIKITTAEDLVYANFLLNGE